MNVTKYNAPPPKKKTKQKTNNKQKKTKKKQTNKQKNKNKTKQKKQTWRYDYIQNAITFFYKFCNAINQNPYTTKLNPLFNPRLFGVTK